ncbi:MAG: BON domain-containing protein [Rhizobacter sp.]|nr:BON domain-containing protein [Ferruginibacter sp.]
MKNNEELQKDVQDAIKWEPLLNAAEIGVTVKDGIVTLNGVVNSYAKKLEAEQAAKNVAGVKVVVEKLEVSFGTMGVTPDGDIAAAIVNAFKWSSRVPDDKVKVKVENGYVTLDGELNWNSQRQAAKDAVKNLLGVKYVTNNITIQSESRDAIEQSEIEAALRRDWSINDDDISVEVSGTKVTLTGTVKSWYQKNEAETIAWKAAGVWSVDNQLEVEYYYDMVS